MPPADDEILRMTEVEKMVKLHRNTIRRHVASGNFPAPVQLTPHLIGWRRSSIATWISELPPATHERRV
jgi:hypothetical protein